MRLLGVLIAVPIVIYLTRAGYRWMKRPGASPYRTELFLGLVAFLWAPAMMGGKDGILPCPAWVAYGFGVFHPYFLLSFLVTWILLVGFHWIPMAMPRKGAWLAGAVLGITLVAVPLWRGISNYVANYQLDHTTIEDCYKIPGREDFPPGRYFEEKRERCIGIVARNEKNPSRCAEIAGGMEKIYCCRMAFFGSAAEIALSRERKEACGFVLEPLPE